MKFDENILRADIAPVHTTPMGAERICKNLRSGSEDVVQYCKSLILSDDCRIYRKGKNLYCEKNGIRITINAGSYTIITAHKI